MKYALLHWSDWSETDTEDVGRFEGINITDRLQRFYDDKEEAEQAAITHATLSNLSVFVVEVKGTVSVSHRLELEVSSC